MIGGFVIDTPALVFMFIALVFSTWVVFDAERVLWLPSYGRQKHFSRFEVMVIRVPGVTIHRNRSVLHRGRAGAARVTLGRRDHPRSMTWRLAPSPLGVL